jgi:cytochrome c
LRSAGNTQDLRGKILRIKPLAAGGYDIPKGNLFADAKEGRPEIYVMGARNPYKITYDNHSNTLFFGDVGPDAGADSALQGTRGYDEINRVTHAGNFGWPLFLGNNYAYMNYDYITHQSTALFDPLAPVNHSPRNTGQTQLPKAERAFIWYPYGESEEFPELGKGGRTALVADVFHEEDYPETPQRYPSYYNNTLFIADFMRNWIKAVSFDNDGRILKIDAFAPHISYAALIDARFAPDGTLYTLEYGSAWFKANIDARLSRIEYVAAGNRSPLAKITPSTMQNAAPKQGHPQADAETVAKELMKENNCSSCHSVDIKIMGPAFKDVAARYKNNKNALNYLVNKIAKGGNGAWGEMNMPGFSTLSDSDRTALATYILSLADNKNPTP